MMNTIIRLSPLRAETEPWPLLRNGHGWVPMKQFMRSGSGHMWPPACGLLGLDIYILTSESHVASSRFLKPGSRGQSTGGDT